jgi:hypothetical protein
MFQQVDATIGVSPFVVVPANQLEEAAVQFDARSGVEYTGVIIVQEIR